MKKAFGKKIIIGVTVSALTLLSGCSSNTTAGKDSSSTNSQASNVVRIGVVNPMTGPGAAYGERAKQGAEIAKMKINEKGILGGKKIEFVYEDDQTTPQGGVSAINKLLEDKVDIITGGVNSSVSMAEKDLTKNKIVQIIPTAQSDEITEQGHPWLFRLNNTVSMNGKPIHRFIADTLKPKTVALMIENTDFGKNDMDNLTKEWSTPNSPKIITVEKFEQSQTDFTVMLTKIKSLNPDLLYLANASPSQSATIWKQVQQLGIKAKKVMAGGLLNPDIVKLAGKEATEGIISADVWSPDVNNKENKEFVEAYTKQYKIAPDKVAELSYESIILAAEAIDKAGSSKDYQKIADTLRKNKWLTPRGEIKFDDKGQTTSGIKFQIVKNGEIQLYQ